MVEREPVDTHNKHGVTKLDFLLIAVNFLSIKCRVSIRVFAAFDHPDPQPARAPL